VEQLVDDLGRQRLDRVAIGFAQPIELAVGPGS
jgi:hypothetical protein